MHVKTLLLRKNLERVFRAALLVRCAIDADNILSALQKRLQNRLTKSFLPVNHNPHDSNTPFDEFCCPCWWYTTGVVAGIPPAHARI